jgi:hypothetical protein
MFTSNALRAAATAAKPALWSRRPVASSSSQHLHWTVTRLGESGSEPSQNAEHATKTPPAQSEPSTDAAPVKKRTVAELDAEMMARLEENSGDGGAAGLELEDGQAVAMKRGGMWS